MLSFEERRTQKIRTSLQRRRIIIRKQEGERQIHNVETRRWQRCSLRPQKYFYYAPWICLLLLPSYTITHQLTSSSLLPWICLFLLPTSTTTQQLPPVPLQGDVGGLREEALDHAVDIPAVMQVPAIAPGPRSVSNDVNDANDANAEAAVRGNNYREDIIVMTDTGSSKLREQENFLDWCKTALGIETILETRTFEYYDYMSALPSPEAEDYDFFDDFGGNNNDGNERSEQDYPMIPIRGLQASRDIDVGEIVIRIPFQALLTVSTTIDHDPILSEVMGPKARQKYGWCLGQDDDTDTATMQPSPAPTDENLQDEELDQRADFFELPLLAVALLHHRSLGKDSPMYPYIQMLLESPVDSMPFLWERGEKWTILSEGIRTVARSLRKEMKEMYHIVVEVLIQDHPELFGPPPPQPTYNDNSEWNQENGKKQEQQKKEENEWLFSYKHFKWAFAIVNSRHWELPIDDLDVMSMQDQQNLKEQQPHKRTKEEEDLLFSVDGQVPPAAMPTESWVRQQEHDDHDGVHNQNKQKFLKGTTPSVYSFLAPVADFLNFGPPCTKVRYNDEMHAMDVTASCAFKKGQEVTFWYSDECEHIIVGNYGFTHPMVPKCPTAEDYHQSRDRWRRKAESLGNLLQIAYDDLDSLQWEMHHVQSILADCDCCQDKEREGKPAPELRTDQPSQNHVRGSIANQNKDQHGVRRMWKERITDL